MPSLNNASLRVDRKNHWIHLCSAGDITLKFLHPKRGLAAIEAINIIPRYGGSLIHDCWASYLAYPHCGHGLCGSHLLCELSFVVEANGYPWAAYMKRLLQRTCAIVAKRPSKQLSEHEYKKPWPTDDTTPWSLFRWPFPGRSMRIGVSSYRCCPYSAAAPTGKALRHPCPGCSGPGAGVALRLPKISKGGAIAILTPDGSECKLALSGKDCQSLPWGAFRHMADEILTLPEVAKLLKVADKTVYTMARRGELPCFKVRGQWRFRRQDLDAWIAAQTRGGAPRGGDTGRGDAP